MKIRNGVLALLGAGALLGCSASAEEGACRSSLDKCLRQHFEQLDKNLADLMPLVLAAIYRHATDETREAAKFAQAQQNWIAFRDSTCKSEAAILYHVSARTTEGITADCLLRMTRQRLDELRNRWPADRLN
jgi:uncharacterized protein YecT (DUF1311 family)